MAAHHHHLPQRGEVDTPEHKVRRRIGWGECRNAPPPGSLMLADLPALGEVIVWYGMAIHA